MKISEELINESICDYLSLCGGYVMRIAPSGFFKNGKMVKHKSQYIKRGVSDIMFFRDGMFYALEVKTPKEHDYIKKHHDAISKSHPGLLNIKKLHIWEQILFINAMRNNGFIAEFVSSIKDVREIVYKQRENKIKDNPGYPETPSTVPPGS